MYAQAQQGLMSTYREAWRTRGALGWIVSFGLMGFYVVLYFGCVAVVPGEAHPRNYGRDYAVFISPKTGGLYRTSNECRKTL